VSIEECHMDPAKNLSTPNNLNPSNNLDPLDDRRKTASDINGIVRILESLESFPKASRPAGVLVASTSLDTRLLLAHLLENLGYGVWTTASGSDALQTGIEHYVAIDMLLCDEEIPDVPVPELFMRLKARIPGLRCYVMATTKQRIRANEAARLGATVLSFMGPTVVLGTPTDLGSIPASLEGVLSADEICQLEQSGLTLEDAIRAIESSGG
jgi:CheY-like chemotaxis protein